MGFHQGLVGGDGTHHLLQSAYLITITINMRIVLCLLIILECANLIAGNEPDESSGEDPSLDLTPARLAALRALSQAGDIQTNRTSDSSGRAVLKVPMIRNGTSKPVIIDLQLHIAPPKTILNESEVASADAASPRVASTDAASFRHPIQLPPKGKGVDPSRDQSDVTSPRAASPRHLIQLPPNLNQGKSVDPSRDLVSSAETQHDGAGPEGKLPADSSLWTLGTERAAARRQALPAPQAPKGGMAKGVGFIGSLGDDKDGVATSMQTLTSAGVGKNQMSTASVKTKLPPCSAKLQGKIIISNIRY
jgi:hypothetical protein